MALKVHVVYWIMLQFIAVHTSAPVLTAKVERVKRPTVTAAGTSEDWAYFLSRWTDYVAATKLDGKDKVIQLPPKRLTIDTDTRPHQPLSSLLRPVTYPTVTTDTTVKPASTMPMKPVTLSEQPVYLPAVEPSCETTTPTKVQNPCHQLTYTEPRTQDANSPPDVATGPPCAETTVAPSPRTVSTPTLPRRTSRIRHAPEWQKDFVCE